jgi:hypothetical protein
MKPKLLTIANHDIISNISCDCGVCLLSTHEAQMIKNTIDQKIRFGFLGGFVSCVEFFINRWVEYRDPVDLMDHPSNMEIGLSWFQKGTNNKWTHDLMDHLMANLETKIAICMTCIADLDANELHPGDKNVFQLYQ